MPEHTTSRRDDRPSEGFTTTHLPSDPDRPVRLFLPADYQPKYAYPLVVLFHPNGSDEDAAARLVPGLSRRNYIAACPRGGIGLGYGPRGQASFAWDDADPRLDGYLFEVLAHARNEYHVHPNRIYFVGLGEGAAVAYRLGLALSRQVAGIASLNGRLPMVRNCRRAMSGTRVFIGHGANNPVVPISLARRHSGLLDAAGALVNFTSYQTTHRIHPEMLRDVNRWIMGAVTADKEKATILG